MYLPPLLPVQLTIMTVRGPVAHPPHTESRRLEVGVPTFAVFNARRRVQTTR